MTTQAVKVKRAERWPYIWAAVVMVLVITLAGFITAYVRASAAAEKAQEASLKARRVSQCLNDVLATRDTLTKADHANERQKILDQKQASKDQNAGLAELAVAKTAKDGIAAYQLFQKGSAEFEQALNNWLKRDAAIADQRKAHPLGRC